MREGAGLTRDELALKSGVSLGTLGRVEREVGAPNLDTLAQILQTLNLTLVDFSIALAEMSGVAVEHRGKVRGEWLSVLSNRGVSDPVLAGIASSIAHDPSGPADLIESARAAAEQLARTVLADMRRIRPHLAEVAEGEPLPYDPTSGRGPGGGGRKPSPR
jgi:transcriptional regulator with XRE-family HTH domain